MHTKERDEPPAPTTRRAKTVSIDDQAVHDEVRPLLVDLFDQATPDLGQAKIQETIDLVLRAATRATAINHASKRTKTGGGRSTHARRLAQLDLECLEDEVNRVLWDYVKPRLPTGRVEAAVDLNKQPYHGDPHESPDELYRSSAQSGTTWFHCYATLYLAHRNKRYTTAVRFVRAGMTPTQALKSLLDESIERGFKPYRVYADKGFATGQAIAYLQATVPCFIVPLPIKGKRAKALCRGRGAYWTTYELAGVTVPVCVVVKRNTGKYHGKKKGNAYFPYLTGGLGHKTPQRVDRFYRNRGGIESSYTLVNTARPRTSSRNPAIRLFYYAVALVLQNAWVALRWVVMEPRRGRAGRRAPKGFFGFAEFLDLLAARLRKLYGEVLVIYQLEPGG